MPEHIKNEDIENVSGGVVIAKDRYSFTEGESFWISSILRYALKKGYQNLGLEDVVEVKVYATNPATKRESYFEDKMVKVSTLIESLNKTPLS